jgi:5S rRNA maturation endonuclease (ribonuclease M5)
VAVVTGGGSSLDAAGHAFKGARDWGNEMTNIAAYMEQVARHYWGEPNPHLSKGTELRFGNNGSVSVCLRKGVWTNFETGESGGVIDAVRANEPASICNNIPDLLERKFGISRQAQKALPTVPQLAKAYDYYNSDGALSYQIQRYEPKTFRQRRPDDKGGWVYSMTGVEAVPYNLPAIMQNPQAPIFVVEGEKCADALIELGLIATTNHGGSKNWKPELAQYFAGRNVIVLPDNDEAGQAHADKVIAELYDTANKIKRLDLPNLPPKGDVADWLAAGNGKSVLLELAKQAPAIEQAPEIKPDIYPLYDEAYLMNMPPVEWMIEGVLTKHGFAVMYGAPGTGKSFIAIDMALCMAHGIAWHGRATNAGAVLYIAGEGVGGLGKRVKAWKAHHELSSNGSLKVLPVAVDMIDDESIDKLLRTIDSLNTEFSCLVIDTVARSMTGEENSATDMSAFVRGCDAIKHHTGCGLLAIHHAGKDASRGINSMRGSSALAGAADTVLSVGKAENIVALGMEKQKDAEPMDKITFEMTPIALMDDTSIVMKPIEAQGATKKQDLSARQYHAFQSLQNTLIKLTTDALSVDQWHEAHRSKSPDLTSAQRKDARQGLQDKGVVTVHEGKVWINKEIAGNVG